MAITFKLPFGSRGAAGDGTARASGGLPLIGRLPLARQLRILVTGIVLLLVAAAALVAWDTREGTIGTIYIETVGKIRMLSQRLAKAAQQASRGNLEAFKQLRESREEFASLVKLLAEGGSAGGTSVPATSSAARPALEALQKDWATNEANAALVI